MKFGTAATCIVLAISAVPASAGWSYHKDESAFGERALHFVLVDEGKAYSFGFQCGDDALHATYYVADKSFSQDEVRSANAARPIIRLLIDDQPIAEIPATLAIFRGELLAQADVSADLFGRVKDAKKRMVAALRVDGYHIHEHSFAVRGSTSAMKRLNAACGLK
ncbi:MAG: hypothetical protein WA975_21505 [Mesorhizobium sp.]